MKGPLIWVITSVSIEFDKKFRSLIAEKNNGIRKGDLRKAVIEAVQEWVDKQELRKMVK